MSQLCCPISRRHHSSTGVMEPLDELDPTADYTPSKRSAHQPGTPKRQYHRAKHCPAATCMLTLNSPI